MALVNLSMSSQGHVTQEWGFIEWNSHNAATLKIQFAPNSRLRFKKKTEQIPSAKVLWK